MAEQTVRERSLSLKNDDPPADAPKGLRAMNRRPADDHATGILQDEEGFDVMRCDGQEAERERTIGPVKEAGTLDGVLIRIGGKGPTVPVHLMDGNTLHKCTASRETAQELAVHLFSTTLRVEGNGIWEYTGDGRWILKRFDIERFRALSDTPLTEVARLLGEISGSGWGELEDPFAELMRLRDSDEC